MQTRVATAERRHSTRGSVRGEPARDHLVVLIVRTYRQMPGLILQVEQASRLFGLRELTCRVVMDDLVRQGQLRRSAAGQYLAP